MKTPIKVPGKETQSKPQSAALPGRKVTNTSGMLHPLIDGGSRVTTQAKRQQQLFGRATQRQADLDEDELQGKFKNTVQRQTALDEDELQGKFTAQAKSPNKTGMPDDAKAGMESTFGTDFSGVRIHANSANAPQVGALAYTRGQDIHFAPGQFRPDTPRGQQLLGHELTHVIQQREGRVQPTTEVAGMPVNDNPALEREADDMGRKASR